jgi:tetratricopeptide (TPR) repeat protein
MKQGPKTNKNQTRIKTSRIGPHGKTSSGSSLMPWLLLVFIVSILLYSGTLGHGYVLDDNGVIEDNLVVKQGIKGIPLILQTPYRYGVSMLEDNLYRPLSLVMFAIEWQIAPGNPMIGHLVNVLLNAITCVLLLIVLIDLFPRLNPVYPLFASLLWMVHPVHAEVVANIKSRDEMLSLFFLLLAVKWFINYMKTNRFWIIIASLAAYFLALMSKEGVITFLLIMPLIGWYLNKEPKLSDLKQSLLFLIPAAFFLLIRHLVLNAWASPASNTLLDNLLLAAPDIQSRFATAIMLLGKYLLLLIFPLQLVSDYSYNQIPIIGWINPWVLLSLAVYSVALWYGLSRLKTRSFLVFGILLFLVTMSIYSNLFVLIGSSFAERFLYVPSIGFAMVLAALILDLFKVKDSEQNFLSFPVLIKTMKFPLIFLLVIMALSSIRTVSRSADWKDEFTLFSKDVKKSPNSAHMRLYWGNALRDKAKVEKDADAFSEGMKRAIVEFEAAIAIYPDYPDAWQQLGLAYYRLGEADRSLECYNKAISLNPQEATTYANIGAIFFQRGDYSKAIELYRKSLQLDPNYPDAYLNLGSSFGMTGEFKKAAENFHKCLELEPGNAKACYFLGITYRSLNNESESRLYLEKAARLDPSLVP